MVQHHTRKVAKTAHFYTHGAPTAQTQYFWFASHGYGQLASQLIYKFRDFDASTHFVVAPEGLSRFYWKMQSDQIGASWMTKLDRLDEIADFCNYLTDLFDEYRAQLPDDVRVVLFGFSQGCATLLRWLMRTHTKFDTLVLWGGPLPEDLDYQTDPFLRERTIHLVVGDTDEFIDAPKILKHLEFALSNHLNVQFHGFEGKHEIPVEVFMGLFEQYWQ